MCLEPVPWLGTAKETKTGQNYFLSEFTALEISGPSVWDDFQKKPHQSFDNQIKIEYPDNLSVFW